MDLTLVYCINIRSDVGTAILVSSLDEKRKVPLSPKIDPYDIGQVPVINSFAIAYMSLQKFQTIDLVCHGS